jgi:hypothetical protein
MPIVVDGAGAPAQSLLDILQPATDDASRCHDFCVAVESILSSYDDAVDAFSETIQNSMDAILERWDTDQPGYAPRLDIILDYRHNRLGVLDNGCGVEPDHLPKVLRPNCSLKRQLHHKNARGEKGAAAVFLQFGHQRFEFHTKVQSGSRSYTLPNGASWFRSMVTELDAGAPTPQTANASGFMMTDAVDPVLRQVDRGCYVSVEFGQNSNLKQLVDLFSPDPTTALKRADYLLRTRTAVGYVYTKPNGEDIPPCVRNLHTRVILRTENGQEYIRDVKAGFLYPP